MELATPYLNSEHTCSAASRFCIQNMFCIYRTITEPYRTITEPSACISDGSVFTEQLQNHWLAALHLHITDTPVHSGATLPQVSKQSFRRVGGVSFLDLVWGEGGQRMAKTFTLLTRCTVTLQK